MSIKLKGKVSCLTFYNQLLDEVASYYLKWDGKTPPVFDFSEIEYIDPPFLTLFAGLGLFLKKYHIDKGITDNTYLDIINNPKTIKTIYFLDKSDFFKIVGNPSKTQNFEFSLDIYDFNNNIVGGYTGYVSKQQRIEHKLNVYFPNQDRLINYNLLSEEDKRRYRDELLESFIIGRVRDDFDTVIYDEINDPLNQESILFSISELIENGIVHSGSEVFALINTNRYRSIISVADIGIGFEESLNSKEASSFPLMKFHLLNYFKKHDYDKDLHTCYIIFEALLFSLTRNRLGLIDIILDYTTNENGIARIHNNDIQVIITYRYSSITKELEKLRREILKTYQLGNTSKLNDEFVKGADLLISLCKEIINNYNVDLNISSLRKYRTIFKGVHIECELKNLNF